jgi:hypothetical protein
VIVRLSPCAFNLRDWASSKPVLGPICVVDCHVDHDASEPVADYIVKANSRNYSPFYKIFLLLFVEKIEEWLKLDDS